MVTFDYMMLAAVPSHQIEITKHSEEIKTLIRNPTMIVSWMLWLNDKEYLNLISKLVQDDHDNSNCETSFVEAEATSCNRVTPRDSLSQEFSSSPASSPSSASSSSSPLLSSKQERGGSSVLSALGCLSLVAETCQRDPVSPLSVSQSVFAPGSLLVFCNLLFVFKWFFLLIVSGDRDGEDDKWLFCLGDDPLNELSPLF